jgi:DnaJ-class molecular chaperone
MRAAEAEDRRLGNLPPLCDRCNGHGVEPHCDDPCWSCNGCGEQVEAA